MATKKKSTKKRPARKKSAKKPSGKAVPKKHAVAKPAKSTPRDLRVRMYRTGLGDCFLLSFPRLGRPFHMLVDCGVFKNSPNEKAILRDVATDIAAATGGRLDVVVGTHEHYDHLIGFKHAKDIFAAVDFGEVWLSWIDKPGDPRGEWLRKIEGRLKNGLRLALRDAAGKPGMAVRRRGLEKLLEFEGDPLAANYSEQLGDIKRWLREEKQAKVQYLEPHGRPLALSADLPDVRVFVLGPPLNEKFFRKLDDSKKSPETYRTSLPFLSVPSFLHLGADAEPTMIEEQKAVLVPFEPMWQIRESDAPRWKPLPRWGDDAAAAARREAARGSFFERRYGFRKSDDLEWRRIDHDWMAAAEELALQLNSLTNNSSLALAIEVGSSRRVVLLAGDAQVGNWLSWHEGTWNMKRSDGSTENVSAQELLGRTVLYKVGHHGSHNATLRQKGLEMMTSQELVAMIPVNEKFARDVQGWQMPYAPLLRDLTKRTKGRVLRADQGLPDPDRVETGARKGFFARATETPLYVEYRVPID